ncbi:MAG: hypothetical protein PVG66_14510 [Chromatiales bacterium]
MLNQPLTAANFNMNYRGNLFLEMMLTMMEMMGFIDRDNYYSNQPYPNYNTFAPNLYGYGFSNPWQGGMPGAGWNSLPGLTPLNSMNAFGNPWDVSSLQPGQTHWIEGRWQAADGMLFVVQQGQFRMFYPQWPQETRSGLIRIKDRWLAIYEQQSHSSQQFEFAYQDEYLVLSDEYDNMMLFRKLFDWPMP